MADWGAMLEDTGEEEQHAAWVYFTRAGRLKPGIYYGKCKAFSVTLNYVLGLGCLGIPYAFYEAGLTFSIVMTIVAAFLSMISTMWIVEVHMRAMLVETGRRHERAWSEQQVNMPSPILSRDSSITPSSSSSTDGPQTPKQQRRFKNELKSPGTASQLTELLKSPQFFASTKFPIVEVAELVKGVLGQTYEILYMICLSGLAVTGLWAYSNVAANSLVQQVQFFTCGQPNYLGVCGYEYMLNCAGFGIIVRFYSVFFGYPRTRTHLFFFPSLSSLFFFLFVSFYKVIPLSLLDTAEQATIQTIFTILRFITLGAMAMGAVLGVLYFPISDAFPNPLHPPHPCTLDAYMGYDCPHPHSDSSLSHLFNNTNTTTTPSSILSTSPPYIGKGVDWGLKTDGMGLLISSMCFSMLFQHSIPGLMAAIDPNKRKSVKQVFGAALTTSCFLYIILGVTMALYFGSTILPSSNLNFVDFNFGMGEPSNAMANILSYTIVLFPVFGSISVYPLIAITLSNNLHVSTARFTGWTQDDRKAKIFWRLIAAVPPILLSLLVRNLSTIIQFSGLFAVPIAYLFPALLQLYSKSTTEFHEIPEEFSWHFNQHMIYPYVMLLLSVGVWGLVVVQLVQHLLV